MPLSSDDPRPPYLQIADDLRRAIRQGEFAPGQRLPSTTELVERYDVARMTVRSALRLLSEEGLLVARQGSGVFVRSELPAPAPADPAEQLEAVMRLLGDVVQDVQRLGARVAELEQLVHRPDGRE